MREQEKLRKIRKEIMKDLKDGEPFSYKKNGDSLVIGVRMGFGKTTDEFEIYVCDQYNMTDSGIIVNKKTALNLKEQGKICNGCGKIIGTNKECWLCGKFYDALHENTGVKK